MDANVSAKHHSWYASVSSYWVCLSFAGESDDDIVSVLYTPQNMKTKLEILNDLLVP